VTRKNGVPLHVLVAALKQRKRRLGASKHRFVEHCVREIACRRCQKEFGDSEICPKPDRQPYFLYGLLMHRSDWLAPERDQISDKRRMRSRVASVCGTLNQYSKGLAYFRRWKAPVSGDYFARQAAIAVSRFS